MNRTQAINAIRYEAYHGRMAEAQTLYIENRVSIQVYRETVKAGVAAKERGLGCGCAECNSKKASDQ